MISTKVRIKSIAEVKDFVNCTNKCSGSVTVKSDRYIIDGKSIMGLFSLDFLNKDITVELDNESDKASIEKYIV